MWNKTRSPKYKEMWYKLVEEYVQNINNTDTVIRRNPSKRGVRIGKTNGSTRMSNVCRRS